MERAVAKKADEIESVENLTEGLQYHVWFSIPLENSGGAYRSAFTDTFTGFAWANKRMLVVFTRQDAVDVAHLTKILEA